MAAGQGFKTFTTGEVLTAADTNGYLMQGVLVFADAAARTAAIASPQEGQMSYLKDTNSTEYYSGSAWVAVGAAGGAYTLLSTTSITSTSTTVSSISQSYQDLFIEVYGITFSTSNSTPTLTINASGSTAIRSFANSYTSQNASSISLYGGANDWDRTNANNYFGLHIYNYPTTDRRKSVLAAGIVVDSSATTQPYGWSGAYDANTAISQIAINIGGGRTFSSGTIRVWGVK